MNAAQWLLSLSGLLSGTAAQHMQSVQSGGSGETIYATVLRVSVVEPVLYLVSAESKTTYTQKAPAEKPANPKNIKYAYAFTEIDSGYVMSIVNSVSVLQVKR